MDSSIHITVFGGSLTNPGEPAYQEAFHLGWHLGQAGWTVLTGGYIGTMEAVSRGAAEAGAHVIGVTCDEIEAWRPVSPNPWVLEERRFQTSRQRLYALIDGCDAALALPGGIGTLAEIVVMWSQIQTGAIPPRSLILIGFGWQETFDQFIQSLGKYVKSTDRSWLTYSQDIEGALAELRATLNH